MPVQGPWKSVLDAISREETNQGLPDITFVLVNKSTGYPSQIAFSQSRNPTSEQKESSLAHLLHKSPRIPQQLRNLAPARDCFSRVVSVLEGILVTLRGSRGHPAVHSAAAVRHRR